MRIAQYERIITRTVFLWVVVAMKPAFAWKYNIHCNDGKLGDNVYKSTNGIDLDELLTKGIDYQPNDLLLFNPSVNFAVNNWATLTYRLQRCSHQVDEISSRTKGPRTTETVMSLGLGYACSQQLTLNFTDCSNINSQKSAEIGLIFLYEWDGDINSLNQIENKEINIM